MGIQKVVRDGKVAVLVSPGFGAGWSSWTHEEPLKTFMLFDKSLVELAERGGSKDEAEHILAANGFDDYVCTLGWPVKIEWVPEGSPFRIDEYDGSETLMLPSDFTHVA